MPELFLQLPPYEQREIIQTLAPETRRSAAILEKDIWVCWVLRSLFSMPGRAEMVFKGGTSLSKVYSAIDRFSEDIDVTVDFHDLVPDLDPLEAGLSNRKREELREQLETKLTEYLNDVVAPHLRASLAAEYGGPAPNVIVDAGGEKVYIEIGESIQETGYIREGVLLEFGGRNVIEPNGQHWVRPYLAEHLTQLELPNALVDVLAPERTFWEKATLIHAECSGRDVALKGANRLSRHWYDLAHLAQHDIGPSALSQINLLFDVVRVKKIAYRSAKARYDDCTSGHLRLIPEEVLLTAIKEDYEAMKASGMFEGEPMSFDDILRQLRDTEAAINSAAISQKTL